MGVSKINNEFNELSIWSFIYHWRSVRVALCYGLSEILKFTKQNIKVRLMSGWVIGDCALIGFLRAAHKPKSNGT